MRCMPFDRITRLMLFLCVVLLVGCKQPTEPGDPPGPPSVCGQPVKVGFRVVTIGTGRRMGVWYPTSDNELPLQYANETAGSAARDGASANCGRLPVVVF